MEEPTRQRRLEMLWEHVTDAIKKLMPSNPTVWHAMEAAKPLAAEESLLVLGMTPASYHLASYLEKPGTRATIEEQLSRAARSPIHYRIIDGETVADWMEFKEGERIAKELEKLPQRHYHVPDHHTPRAPGEDDLNTWEHVVNYTHRVFQALPARSSCQTRALYILDMMPVISEAEDRLHRDLTSRAEERSLLHVLEKIAQMTEVEPVVVSLEYFRYRANHKGAAGAPHPAKETTEA